LSTLRKALVIGGSVDSRYRRGSAAIINAKESFVITNLNTLDTQGSDVSWVRQSFLVPSSYFAPGSVDASNRFYTSAALKYVDTRPGGNIAINPPPQFTRYADPKAPSRLNGSNGLGIYYSEAIDDNAHPHELWRAAVQLAHTVLHEFL
jgi:hypothetical protein